MRLISWNVNGLRACVGKGFLDFFDEIRADAVCLQETKMQPDQLTLELEGYSQYWNSAVKKGYSGTAIFSKHTPMNVTYGMPDYVDDEGNVDWEALGKGATFAEPKHDHSSQPKEEQWVEAIAAAEKALEEAKNA